LGEGGARGRKSWYVSKKGEDVCCNARPRNFGALPLEKAKLECWKWGIKGLERTKISRGVDLWEYHVRSSLGSGLVGKFGVLLMDPKR